MWSIAIAQWMNAKLDIIILIYILVLLIILKGLPKICNFANKVCIRRKVMDLLFITNGFSSCKVMHFYHQYKIYIINQITYHSIL